MGARLMQHDGGSMMQRVTESSKFTNADQLYARPGEDKTFICGVQRGGGSPELADVGSTLPGSPTWLPHCQPHISHQQQSGQPNSL